jgi:ATP-dependent Clp protease, protease subunit
VERILKDGERDRWFTPEEALDYGMIDRIIERPGRSLREDATC